jgi:hypothetical protein
MGGREGGVVQRAGEMVGPIRFDSSAVGEAVDAGVQTPGRV